jgi:shikimate dehydrogenase
MGIPYAEVIGDPIAQSKSPLIHKFWLEQLGIEGDYQATRVSVEELPSYLATRRTDPDWRGCNVTMPLKELMCQRVDEFEFGIRLEAVNCVVPRDGKLIGANTDTGGLDLAWPDIAAGRQICVIGAGGAAKAAFESLDVICASPLHVVARDAERARVLVEPQGEYGRWFSFEQAEQALAGCVGVVNASPLGMTGFPEMPESILAGLTGIRRGGFVLDMVYSPLETRFLQRAAQLGLQTIDGLVMLVGQASFAFYHFFGQAAPRGCDAQLRRLLTS